MNPKHLPEQTHSLFFAESLDLKAIVPAQFYQMVQKPEQLEGKKKKERANNNKHVNKGDKYLKEQKQDNMSRTQEILHKIINLPSQW